MTETRGATATPQRGSGVERGERRNLPARIALYYRQVIAELRKVIWPGRQQLVTYTTVVVVFVTVMIGIVSLLDFGFSRAVLWLFG